MKKETIITFLTNSCFLMPGNVRQSKTWFLSVTSALSLIGLILAIFSCINEFVGWRQPLRTTNNNDTILIKFKYMPVRQVAYCLKMDELMKLGADAKFGTSGVVIDELTTQPKKSNNKSGPPRPRKPELLEEIVFTAYRVLIFVVNIFIRIFTWISFPKVIETFSLAFGPNDRSQSEYKNSLMHHMWYESVQKWSPCEKIFLGVILVSQLQRELEMLIQFYFSLKEVGLEFVSIPCVLFQLAIEQAKVLYSLDLVLEVTTFILLVIIRSFVNILWTVSGGPDEDNGGTNGADEGVVNSSNKVSGKGVVSKGIMSKGAAQALFVKTLEPTSHNGNLIMPNAESLHHEASHHHYNPELNLMFQTPPLQKYSIKYPSGMGKVEVIYSQMNFIVSMYFDLMTVWEQTLKVTGFVTLMLFCELTTTFCLNTYTTLDSAMKFGILSSMGACGILRGCIIVTKLVSVCNAAQCLQDMTQILIDGILKLKLKLLSLPKEVYRKSMSSGKLMAGNTGIDSSANCEKCRGLGSFLTEVVSYIRSHPFELSALGYFSVSRSSLTTITGVIVTYLVVLVQFQSYATSSTPT